MSRGLSIALHSDAADRAHYALVLAAAALAIDRPVLLFFAGPAVVMTTATPGWRGLQGAEAHQTRCEAAGVAGFPELAEACAALGVQRLACEVALALAQIAPDRLEEGVTVGGAVTFLARSQGYETLFI